MTNKVTKFPDYQESASWTRPAIQRAQRNSGRERYVGMKDKHKNKPILDGAGEDTMPAGGFRGEESLPPGGFRGEEQLPPGGFRGEEQLPPGGFRSEGKVS